METTKEEMMMLLRELQNLQQWLFNSLYRIAFDINFTIFEDCIGISCYACLSQDISGTSKSVYIYGFDSYEENRKQLNYFVKYVKEISKQGNHVGAFAALCELLTIADEWNKADGFKVALCCQDRFIPWFKYDDATGKYVYANTAYSWTYVGVRIPRLSFKTKDRAEQFGKQFVQLYNKIFLID